MSDSCFFGLPMMTDISSPPKSFQVIGTGLGLLRHHLYSHTYQNPLDTRKVKWITVLSLRECSSFPNIRCNSLGFAAPLAVFWRAKRTRDRSYLEKYIYCFHTVFTGKKCFIRKCKSQPTGWRIDINDSKASNKQHRKISPKCHSLGFPMQSGVALSEKAYPMRQLGADVRAISVPNIGRKISENNRHERNCQRDSQV